MPALHPEDGLGNPGLDGGGEASATSADAEEEGSVVPTCPRERTTMAEASSAVGSREKSKDRLRSTELEKSGGQTGQGHC